MKRLWSWLNLRQCSRTAKCVLGDLLTHTHTHTHALSEKGVTFGSCSAMITRRLRFGVNKINGREKRLRGDSWQRQMRCPTIITFVATCETYLLPWEHQEVD